MATKTADKYKIIVNISDYFYDITKAAVSSTAFLVSLYMAAKLSYIHLQTAIS